LGDKDEDEQQKRPWLLVAPSVENPSGDHHVEEEINDPDGMDPVNPPMGAGLEHSPTPPSTRVMPRARMIEIRTERYPNAAIG
jgi:hypothetical protein